MTLKLDAQGKKDVLKTESLQELFPREKSAGALLKPNISQHGTSQTEVRTWLPPISSKSPLQYFYRSFYSMPILCLILFPHIFTRKTSRNPKKFPHPPIIAALRSTLSSTSRAAISRSSASFPSGPVSSGQSWSVGSGGSCNQTWHTNTLPTKGPVIYMSTGLSVTILNYHPLQCVEPLHLPPMAYPPNSSCCKGSVFPLRTAWSTSFASVVDAGRPGCVCAAAAAWEALAGERLPRSPTWRGEERLLKWRWSVTWNF